MGRALLLLGLLGGAGCEGENLFAPGSGIGDGVGPHLTLLAPKTGERVAPGDSLAVRIRVEDPDGLDSLRIEGFVLRENPDIGTVEAVPRWAPLLMHFSESPRDTLVERALPPLSEMLRETAHVLVHGWDSFGNERLSDTVRIEIAGPSLRFLLPEEGGAWIAGAEASVRVHLEDPMGIDRVEIGIEGAVSDVLRHRFQPAPDTVTLDTLIAIPEEAAGELTLAGRVWNRGGESGRIVRRTLRVVSPAEGDRTVPSAEVAVAGNGRLEVGDSLVIDLRGEDEEGGSGIAAMGVTVFTIEANGDTVGIHREERTFPRSPGRFGEARFAFVPPRSEGGVADSVTYLLYGFVVDRAGNCASAGAGGGTRAAPCAESSVGRIGAGIAPLVSTHRLVSGRTVRLPAGGRILDAVVDPRRRTLLLSNQDGARVEIFDLRSRTFGVPIRVGSQPWGMTLLRGGDTLLVANSGGAGSFSRVWLGSDAGAGARETGRIDAPDVRLLDLTYRTISSTGGGILIQEELPGFGENGFSDRPQSVAQDSLGRLLYSTTTSPGALRGVLLKAEFPAGGEPEVTLFHRHASFLPAPEYFAAAALDSIRHASRPIHDSAGAVIGTMHDVLVADHRPGFPTIPIEGRGRASEFGAALQAAADDARAQGSDLFLLAGHRWDPDGFAFEDTTWVGASGDGGRIVVGEGGTAPLGRVLLYDAGEDRISSQAEVSDLLQNAGEAVRGVALNHDGTLGVLRGERGAQFFDPSLRVRGAVPLPAGGTGATLHPLHAGDPGSPGGRYDPNTHLAFAGSDSLTIEILDTHHFDRVGSLPLRDRLAGPLRAVLPFGTENEGRSCRTLAVRDRAGRSIGRALEIFADPAGTIPHPAEGGVSEDACVAVKLYGMTDSGGVVVVDVTKGDLLRAHPSRR